MGEQQLTYAMFVSWYCYHYCSINKSFCCPLTVLVIWMCLYILVLWHL